jgi:uncharacterized phage protein (TIGR02218 family)
LNQAEFSRLATVQLGSTTSQLNLSLGSGSFDGDFSLGGVLGISGGNTSVLRTVKSWSGTTATMVNPLPVTPIPGETFRIWPGCEKTMTACDKGYQNIINFRGFPFVPAPETMR